MNTFLRRLLVIIPLLTLSLFFTAITLAAAPDGLGPWADTVVGTNQGLMKNGNPVPAIRSDPTSALGVAEDNTTDGNFYSLGFGGSITLGFDNGISSGVIIVEATNPNYPVETAQVEVSPDSVNWTIAGNVAQDGRVEVPANLGCVHFVRVTDTSNPNDFQDATADAYDVDGVQGIGNACATEGKMTGGGSVFTRAGVRVTHGFEFYCDATDGPNNLEINWDKGNKFHLEDLDFAFCSDEPGIDEGNPDAGFDTYQGEGTGRFNGQSGYSIKWLFTDAGEPGKNDTANIVIKDPSNVTILSVSGNLKSGNQQAH
ncbi:MAG: hypothetical protein HY430_04090 [Candidatus Levybacteria bacterium]|nr:hypothetical protein [Candidatus Levybacteria bacterium]